MKLRSGEFEVDFEVDDIDKFLSLPTVRAIFPAVLSAMVPPPPAAPRANETVLAEWRELSAKFKAEGITLMLSEMNEDEVKRTVQLAMELGILGG